MLISDKDILRPRLLIGISFALIALAKSVFFISGWSIKRMEGPEAVVLYILSTFYLQFVVLDIYIYNK